MVTGVFYLGRSLRELPATQNFGDPIRKGSGMATKPRTFTVTQPRMKGLDVKDWQNRVKRLFKALYIDCPIENDGVYGIHSRSYTADLVHASGLSIKTSMKDGVTPELRTKLRTGDLTPAQTKVKNSKARREYRDKLNQQYALANPPKVHAPAIPILTDAWGFHPGIHDGEDVVTQSDAVCFAMVKSKIIDVRSTGWWNLGAPDDPALKAKGDGIIQMVVLEDVGPFKKGMHIGYGHQEKAMVKVGDVVEAGRAVGHAGFANAWHIHLMVNDNKDLRGIGTIDPRPLIDYAVKHG